MSTTARFGSAACATLLIFVGLVWWMNLGYGRVSDTGYEFAMALMSICNREDGQRLKVLAEKIHAAEMAGELSEYDVRVLVDITDRASQGEWAAAARAVRRLMEDQVERTSSSAVLSTGDARFNVG